MRPPDVSPLPSLNNCHNPDRRRNGDIFDCHSPEFLHNTWKGEQSDDAAEARWMVNDGAFSKRKVEAQWRGRGTLSVKGIPTISKAEQKHTKHIYTHNRDRYAFFLVFFFFWNTHTEREKKSKDAHQQTSLGRVRDCSFSQSSYLYIKIH